MVIRPILSSLCFPSNFQCLLPQCSEWRKHKSHYSDTRPRGAALAVQPAWSLLGFMMLQQWEQRPQGRGGPSSSGPCCPGPRRSICLDPASAQEDLVVTCMLVCFCSGKSNPYCEISMGSQSYTTRTLQDTLNPKWNFNCQFFIKDLYQDVLCLTMFDRDQFSPDGKSITRGGGLEVPLYSRIQGPEPGCSDLLSPLDTEGQ